MTREQAKRWLSVITAFAEGKTIQLRECQNNWDDLTCGDVKFDGTEYRVKPKQKLRAWNVNDDILGMKVCYKKNKNMQSLIAAKDDNYIAIAAHCFITYEKLLKEYEQLDGSPCGVMEGK